MTRVKFYQIAYPQTAGGYYMKQTRYRKKSRAKSFIKRERLNGFTGLKIIPVSYKKRR